MPRHNKNASTAKWNPKSNGTQRRNRKTGSRQSSTTGSRYAAKKLSRARGAAT